MTKRTFYTGLIIVAILINVLVIAAQSNRIRDGQRREEKLKEMVKEDYEVIARYQKMIAEYEDITKSMRHGR